jgi:serine/threonine protein kinase
MTRHEQEGQLERCAELASESAVADCTPFPRARIRLEPPQASDSSQARGTKAALLDQAYQDFCKRREQGEQLDPDAYCAQFPSMLSALTKLLQAQLFLEEHSVLFAEMPEIRWPEAGETFLDYQLKLELGKGAFARVFLATEPKLGNRLVAIKIALHGAGEAEILGRIQHRNIVPVHSVQEDKTSGLTAVCMPYLGSATLCDVLDAAFGPSSASPENSRVILDAVKDVPFPLDPRHSAAPEPVLRNGSYLDGVRLIGAQLADALAFIHERGIHHRDLKPSNVLMSPEGVPMLLDFNLCADSQDKLNRLGGTMAYMSPEQLRATDRDALPGAVALDARSDIFSLGVILYQLMTGEHPFGPVPLKLSSDELRRHLLDRQQQGPIEARRVNPNVDGTFSQLIHRCLAADPKNRPQTAAEIAAALRRELKPLPRIKRWIGQHPRKVLAGLLLLTAVGLTGMTYASLRAPYSERQIEAGLRLHQQGRYSDAVAHFNEALQADPQNDVARFARAHTHQRLGDYNLALQDYYVADKQTPSGRTKAAIAYCLARSNVNPQGAEYSHRRAIESGFATAEVYNNLGFCYMRQSKWKEARECLDRALELDAELQAAYHNRALVAFNQVLAKKDDLLTPGGKEKEVYLALQSGIADAKKAIALGSGSAELYFHAASVCALAAHVDQSWTASAVQYLEESVQQGYLANLNDPIFKPLQKLPTFQALKTIPRSGQSTPPTRRIIDPIQALAR